MKKKNSKIVRLTLNDGFQIVFKIRKGVQLNISVDSNYQSK